MGCLPISSLSLSLSLSISFSLLSVSFPLLSPFSLSTPTMASHCPWLTSLLLILLGAAATAPRFALGRFVVETSSVRVISPQHIRGHHDAAIANYGIPNYGGTMAGLVMYPDKKTTGCEPFDSTFKSKSKSRRPVILLLDRGDCYFALKSWNAQNAGAGAVLIADNIDAPLLTMDTPELQ